MARASASLTEAGGSAVAAPPRCGREQAESQRSQQHAGRCPKNRIQFSLVAAGVAASGWAAPPTEHSNQHRQHGQRNDKHSAQVVGRVGSGRGEAAGAGRRTAGPSILPDSMPFASIEALLTGAGVVEADQSYRDAASSSISGICKSPDPGSASTSPLTAAAVHLEPPATATSPQTSWLSFIIAVFGTTLPRTKRPPRSRLGLMKDLL